MAKELVLRAYPSLGRYHVRLLETSESGKRVLDIREHVSGPDFTGYTRRGIKIASAAEVDLLRDILTQILETGLLR